MFTACDIHAIHISEGNGALDKAIKENEMKKSYVSESTLEVKMDIELGEIHNLIEVLDKIVNDEDSSTWSARNLVGKLRKVRRDAVEEARREFENMLDRV